MLHLVAVSLLFSVAFSAPADSCADQYECLITEVVELSGGKYEICLWWDSTLSGCQKDGTISHACPSTDESDKIEGFKEGRDNRICNTVDCDGYAIFGLKDGKECGGDSGGFAFSGVEGIICSAGSAGGYCGGGNKKDCMWAIPAPECSDETTTQSPENTGTVPPDMGTTEEKVEETVVCNTGAECPEYGTYEACVSIDGCKYDEGSFPLCQPSTDCDELPLDRCVEECGCQNIGGYICAADTTIAGADTAEMRNDIYVDDDLSQASSTKSTPSNTVFYGIIGAVGFVVILAIIVGALYACHKKQSQNKEMNNMADLQNDAELQQKNDTTNITVTNA